MNVEDEMFNWKSAVVGAGIALASISIAAPAQAGVSIGVGHHGVSIRWSHGYGFAPRRYNNYHRYHAPYRAARRHVRRSLRRHHRRGNQYYYAGGHHSGHYYQARNGRNCHPIHRRGQWRGDRAVVGGTMCYNRQGHSYVIKGSRYLINYY